MRSTLTVAALLALVLSNAPALEVSPPAGSSAALVLVVASNRGSQPYRRPLQYADDDGAKYFEVFSAIAGEENTVLLTDFDRDTARLFPDLLDKARSPTRAQLEHAVAGLARKATELKRLGREVRFHFVFAGHGDVDRGRGFLELADGPFTADDVQAMLRQVDATEAHVILDSCNSFFVVNPRKPGGTRFATPRDAAEALGRRLPNVGVFLSTSAQAETFEWSELQSGVFSHAVRSGLLGAADVDGDGRVTYEELAAFVDTAVVDIKNPLFRPTIYARGPNGEDARTILVVRDARRVSLSVDDAGPVRLAARDTDGLRWVDAYKEAETRLTLWFPSSLAARIEIDRLKTADPERGKIDESFALPVDHPEPVKLSSLPPKGTTVAMRGPGEIFQALFSRPFGPKALANHRDQRESRLEPVLALDGNPDGLRPPPTAADREPAATGRPLGWDGPVYVVAGAGASVPWTSVSGSVMGGTGVRGAPRLTLGAGREMSRVFALELEGGYTRATLPSTTFAYPPQQGDALWPTPIQGISIEIQMVPVAANVRVQIPMERARPYLLVGGGFSMAHVEIDPPDFNATLRDTSFVPFAQGGVGLQVDLAGRFFAGIEARYFVMKRVESFGGRIGLSGVNAAASFGARL